jgi:hypothetical protein
VVLLKKNVLSKKLIVRKNIKKMNIFYLIAKYSSNGLLSAWLSLEVRVQEPAHCNSTRAGGSFQYQKHTAHKADSQANDRKADNESS